MTVKVRATNGPVRAIYLYLGAHFARIECAPSSSDGMWHGWVRDTRGVFFSPYSFPSLRYGFRFLHRLVRVYNAKRGA